MARNTSTNLIEYNNFDGFTISGGTGIKRGLTIISGDITLVGGQTIVPGSILLGSQQSNAYDQGYLIAGSGIGIESGNGYLKVSTTFGNSARVDNQSIAIPQGINSLFVTFTQPFTGYTPVVIGNLSFTGENAISAWISGVETGGFGLRFSNTVPDTGYQFSYFAISGNVFNINGGGGNGLPANNTTVPNWDFNAPSTIVTDYSPLNDDFTDPLLYPRWTGFQGGANLLTTGLTGSFLFLASSPNAGNLTRGIIRGLPSGTGAFTVAAKVYISKNKGGQDGKGGIFFGQNLITGANSLPLFHVGFYMGTNVKAITETSANYNTTFNEVANNHDIALTGAANYGWPLYLKVSRAANGNWNHKYSVNGIEWIQISTISPSFTPLCIGLFSNQAGNADRYAYWDWIRFYTGDFGIIGEKRDYISIV